MSTHTTVENESGPGNRWWLPALLALLIAAIVGGAFLASHRHLFSGSATATPTPTATPHLVTATPKPATATPKAGPTGTPKPGPTGTPRPGAVATPKPGPTGTPRPGPTATARPRPAPSATRAASGGASVRTGTIQHTTQQLQTIQQGANQHNTQYTVYLDPFQVVQQTLSQYGFKGTVNIISPPPPPQATPTPLTNAQGQPEVDITVGFAGHKYVIVLVQPVQKGPNGVWVIVEIRQLA